MTTLYGGPYDGASYRHIVTDFVYMPYACPCGDIRHRSVAVYDRDGRFVDCVNQHAEVAP